jgi:hypothetical protein
MSGEPRVVLDADSNYWMVIRPDGERVGRFRSEAEASRYIDRGDHLQPIKKDIKIYVEGVEIPTPPPKLAG